MGIDLSSSNHKVKFNIKKIDIDSLFTTNKNSINILLDNPEIADEDMIKLKLREMIILISYLTSNIKNELGATRHCDFTTMGSQVEEKIIGWNEGKSFKIELYDTKNIPMMKGMNAYFELESHKNGTKLTTIFEYHMNNVIGDLLNNLK